MELSIRTRYKLAKLRRYFNYKDWWNWTFWLSFISLVVWPLINTIGTWERWKWGFFSVDSIPPLIILGILIYCDIQISLFRIREELRSK